MIPYQRIVFAQKALRELGLRQTWHYARYKIKLHSGYLHWKTGKPQAGETGLLNTQLLDPLPAVDVLHGLLGEQGVGSLLNEANEIFSGHVRLFGGKPVPLVLEPPKPVYHWTDYEKKKVASELPDFKLIWEPARFGWATTLARAYHLSQDERYSQAFWELTEQFLEANPPYLGVHWVSAQEAGLRLVSLVFSIQILAASPSSTPERLAALAGAVAVHAERILPTLDYGRAQNNNHQITEALGLLTAGMVLPDHPHALQWRKLGRRWLNEALLAQINPDGAYVQHSSNYHRLMLHAALWAFRLSIPKEMYFPPAILERLSTATAWLTRLLDASSGRLPNLGPNDGANILPLTTCPFDDYRPVLEAASITFRGESLFEPGPWSELSSWTCPQTGSPLTKLDQGAALPSPAGEVPCRIENPASQSWAYFRAASFKSRPGHADQLHLDLWWRGLNLAQDAGTYLYNDPPPWDNSLARSDVHNTLTMNGLDQMTRAGRFLWLDWAQASLLRHEKAKDGAWECLTAEHDGYRKLGLTHQRTVTSHANGGWTVADRLTSNRSPELKPSPFMARVHWLLPDWPWQVEQYEDSAEIRLASPLGQLALSIGLNKAEPARRSDIPPSFMLVRAGELVFGAGQVLPTWGWVSDTYAHKIPALSFSLQIQVRLPLNLISEWKIPCTFC